jgi:pimeloyl-ACP methyl ester carboxylesterase
LPQRANTFPDVLVLVPGILGSVLARDNRDVWGLSTSAVAGAVRSLGGSLQRLALDGDDPDRDDIDGVTATRLLDDVTIVPRFKRVDGYTYVRNKLREHFQFEPGANYFEFPYDWRRDNRVAARQLRDRAITWLEAWRKRSGNEEAKLAFVAHSMGGLVCRYFLEMHEGWRFARTLVTIGTPYRGALNAVDFLANGYTVSKWHVRLADLSAMLRSLTSVYQLLPIYECIDTGSARLLRLTECDRLPEGMDPARVKEADAFHREMERAVAEHHNDANYMGERYNITGVVGTFQPTLLSARVAGDSFEMLREHRGHDSVYTGDGTVPMVSAVPLEYDSLKPQPGWMPLLATDRHSSLQNGNAVIANALNALGGFGMNLGSIRGAAGLSLDIGDVFRADEPVTFSISSLEELRRIAVDVVDTATSALVKQLRVNARTAHAYGIEVGPLPEGSYRITVARGDGTGGADTVSDLILVLTAAS